MDSDGIWIGHFVFFYISRFRVELCRFCSRRVIRHPDAASCPARRSTASGSAGQIVLDVDDVHRVVVKCPHQVLVFRQIRGDFGSSESGPNADVIRMPPDRLAHH